MISAQTGPATDSSAKRSSLSPYACSACFSISATTIYPTLPSFSRCSTADADSTPQAGRLDTVNAPIVADSRAMERIQLPPLDDPSAPQQRDHFLGELLVLRVALSQCSGHSSIWRTCDRQYRPFPQ